MYGSPRKRPGRLAAALRPWGEDRSKTRRFAGARLAAALAIGILVLPTIGLFVTVHLARQAVETRARVGNQRLAAGIAVSVTHGILGEQRVMDALADYGPLLAHAGDRTTSAAWRQEVAMVLAGLPLCEVLVTGPSAPGVLPRSSCSVAPPARLRVGSQATVVEHGAAYVLVSRPLGPGTAVVGVAALATLVAPLVAGHGENLSLVADRTIAASSDPGLTGLNVITPAALALLTGRHPATRMFYSERLHGAQLDSYAPVPGTDLSVFASASTATAFAGADHLTRDLWIGWSVFAVLALVLAAGMAGQLAKRERDRTAADRRYQTLAEALPDGVAIADGDRRLVYCNAALQQMAGAQDEGAWRGRPIDDFRVLAGGDEVPLGPAGRTVGLRRTDGRIVPVETRTTPFQVDGRTGLLSIVRDVTERRAIEAGAAEAERRHRTTLETLAEGVVLYDVDEAGRLTPALVNPTAQHLLDMSLPDLQDLGSMTQTIIDVEGHELPIEQMPVVTTARTGEPIEGFVFGLRGAAGTRWLRTATRPIPGPDGLIAGVVASLTDVTAEQAAQRALEAAHDRFAALIEHGSDLITILDPSGEISYASPAGQSMLGRDPLSCLGRPWTDLLHEEDHLDFARALLSMRGRAGSVRKLVARAAHADGTWRHLEFTLANRVDDPVVGGVVANSRDVTDRVVAAQRLSYQALHDSLTGLANRSLLLERLRMALEVKAHTPRRCAVLFLDLDHFKIVNDSLGHAAGDQLLVAVAQRIESAVRLGDSVARLGGDEFVVLADDVTDVAGAIELAERINTSVGRPLDIGHQTVTVGVSVGIALSEGQTADQLLQEADTALYRAKAAGRGCVEVFDDTMRATASNRLRVEALLRRGIASDLEVFYQPIVELATGATVGAEALARIRSTDGRLVSPGEFMPVAEESGLIVDLGGRVLDMASGQQADWSRRGGIPQMSINVSARQLGSPGLVGRVSDALERNGLRPEQLCIEFTESTLIDSGPVTQRSVEDLRALGVSIALDDFGTGWSSLAYLRRFPIDTVKIDQSFVAGLGIDDGDTEVVKAVIGLGHALGLRTVAEGVETVDQDRLLRELGCDHAQGWLYGRPVPASQWDLDVSTLRRPLLVPPAG